MWGILPHQLYVPQFSSVLTLSTSRQHQTHRLRFNIVRRSLHYRHQPQVPSCYLCFWPTSHKSEVPMTQEQPGGRNVQDIVGGKGHGASVAPPCCHSPSTSVCSTQKLSKLCPFEFLRRIHYIAWLKVMAIGDGAQSPSSLPSLDFGGLGALGLKIPTLLVMWCVPLASLHR